MIRVIIVFVVIIIVVVVVLLPDLQVCVRIEGVKIESDGAYNNNNNNTISNNDIIIISKIDHVNI